MTREEQIDWLCRLRANLNNGLIFTPWNKEFTEALNGVLEQKSCVAIKDLSEDDINHLAEKMKKGEVQVILSTEPCEDVARERFEDLCEYFGDQKDIILYNRKNFKDWLNRVEWYICKVEELYEDKNESCDDTDWMDVPSDEMTIRQARAAVKGLRKVLAIEKNVYDVEDIISRQAALDFDKSIGSKKLLKAAETEYPVTEIAYREKREAFIHGTRLAIRELEGFISELSPVIPRYTKSEGKI